MGSENLYRYTLAPILGDPGATSRDDAIFLGERLWRESLPQGLKSPWALFLTKRNPEVVEIRLLIGHKKFFSGQSTRRPSRVIMSPSYTKWFSSSIDLVAWPVQREDSRKEFQEKNALTKPRKSQTVPWELKIEATPFHQFARRIYWRYFVNLYS